MTFKGYARLVSRQTSALLPRRERNKAVRLSGGLPSQGSEPGQLPNPGKGSVAVGRFGSLAPFVVPTLFDAFAARRPFDVMMRAYTEPEERPMQLLSFG